MGVQAVTDAWALGAAMPALDVFTAARVRYTPHTQRLSRLPFASRGCLALTLDNEGTACRLGVWHPSDAHRMTTLQG